MDSKQLPHTGQIHPFPLRSVQSFSSSNLRTRPMSERVWPLSTNLIWSFQSLSGHLSTLGWTSQKRWLTAPLGKVRMNSIELFGFCCKGHVSTSSRVRNVRTHYWENCFAKIRRNKEIEFLLSGPVEAFEKSEVSWQSVLGFLTFELVFFIKKLILTKEYCYSLQKWFWTSLLSFQLSCFKPFC